MDGNVLLYDSKIKRILEKFLEPTFNVKNDVYLNSLLRYFTGNAETGCSLNTTNLVSQQIFREWILHALTVWENAADKPNPVILSFAVNLTSILSKDQSTFEQFKSHKAFERLITLIEPGGATTTPSVKLAYIKLIASFLNHNSGVLWIISNDYWLEVVNLSLTNQTIYITKEGHRFLADLLDNVANVNEHFCVSIVKTLMAPLSDHELASLNTKGNSMEISDEALYKRLSPSLTLIADILEIFLENAVTAKDFNVVLVFKKNFRLDQCMEDYLLIAQSKELIFELYKIQYILLFFDIVMNADSNRMVSEETTLATTNKLYTIFSTNIGKSLAQNVFKLCYLGLIYWKHICVLMPFSNLTSLSFNHPIDAAVGSTDGQQTILFEHQLVLLQVLPCFVISIRLLGHRKLEECDDELREVYVNKIFKMFIVPTLRSCYQWKDWLMNNPQLFEYARLSLQYLNKSKQYITRDIGATIFQSLIYCLMDIVVNLKEQPEQLEMLIKEASYTALLLDTIAAYIEEFQLSWRDSVETTCVMNLAFDFLGFPSWPPKLVVKALKLVDLSISKYMSPNMALLIDRINDSTMAFIGPLLYAKLHDGNWEIRDSALEVLCTISHNANTKFPSFQKIVLESQLPMLVVKMAEKDGESFVRATALKCLQKMSNVQDFWMDIMKTHNLIEITMNILQTETEGIVRQEAATLMGTIYENHNFPKMELSRVFDVMTHAATADLHWEVKVNALNFWDAVIKNHLQHQGMIDGSFPSVVFSKENRKIVTLNESEVQKRLVKVLLQLSEIGCLGVLITAVLDDCDLEVSKNATRLTQCFIELLKKYKISFENINILNMPMSPLIQDDGIPSPMSQSSSGVSSMVQDGFFLSPSNYSPISNESNFSNQSMTEMTESVINDIINSRDINLLTNVYQPEEVQFSANNFVQLRTKRVVSSHDFLKFAYYDLESRLNEKQNWLKNIDEFGSLLDDILSEYNEADINSMDCY